MLPSPFRNLACAVALIAGSLSGLGGAVVFGADAPTGYLVRTWLFDDGLPHNAVNRVVQDDRGFLWLGTVGGLARFDGRFFRYFPVPANAPDSSYNIRDLVYEGDNSLLLLPATGGVLRLHDGEFGPHPASVALEGYTLWDVFAEPDGTLWVGTGAASVLRWKDGELTSFDDGDGLTLDRAFERYTFARDGSGRTWIAGGRFVGYYRDGKLTRLGDVRGSALMVAPARSGGVWIAGHEGLWRWDQGQLTAILPVEAWPGSYSAISSLREDRDGTLWAGTRRHGLFRLDGRHLSPVATSHNMISGVAEDADGNVWVALNGGGLDRLRRRAFVILDREAGLSEDVSTSVCEDVRGAIWCANRTGGLVRYFRGAIQIFPLLQAPAGPRLDVTTVCPGPDESIWVGTPTGLYRVPLADPHAVQLVNADLAPVTVMYRTRKGEIWVASDAGALVRFDGAGHFRLYRAEDGVPQNQVSAIVEDRSGDIWLGTMAGELFQYRNGVFTRHIAEGDENFAGRVHALHVDARGSLWVATLHGVLLRHEGRWRLFTTADGLPDDYVHVILEGESGRFWFGSRRGIFHLAVENLYAVAEGRQPRLLAVTFGQNEGLEGASSFVRGQPMAWRGRDGRLWMVTYRGVVGLDSAAPPATRPLPVYIDGAQLDQQPVAIRDGVTVPSGTKQVYFELVAVNLAAPERLRLRRQLVGYEPTWVEIGGQRDALYENLPPGKYTLRVQAQSLGGGWSEPGASLSVVVVPAWWQTWWFRGAALLVAAGTVAWMIRFVAQRRLRLRVARLEHERAIELERARIARNLHDEVGGSVTRIGLLAERIKRHAQDDALQGPLSRLVGHARRVASDLENIVWTVTPENDTWDRLAAYLGQLAQDFVRDTEIACAVDGLDSAPALPVGPDTRHHVLAVAKEALNNMLKHARATRVHVTLDFDHENFSLTIADNGVGFVSDPEAPADGNGLENMRSRMIEIGGTVRIQSTPGAGTSVQLRVPLRPQSPSTTSTS